MKKTSGQDWSDLVLGYLAQSVDLFDGTISENIARMAKQPDDAAVVGAAAGC